MTNLYLTPVDDEGKIIYNSKNNSQNADFCSLTGSILIRKMRISASIFSPPVVDVYCLSDELEQNKSTPLHSTFGIVMEEIETYKTDSGEKTERHLTCLISNYRDFYTQFAITAIDKYEMDTLCITLMEKHALTLALTHSFFCIGNSSDAIPASEGRFSVAEIVERLSTIPESSEASDEDEESKPKSIFNFESIELHYRTENKALLARLASYISCSCAFLSRFVAPASQSRLQIISSLMFKYGYGFVYRPGDEQYFAIDLLSMLAPGYKNVGTEGCFVNDKGFETYEDSIIFNGLQSQHYFRNYAFSYMEDDPDYSKGLREFEELINTMDPSIIPSDMHHFSSHDFAYFYNWRFLGNQNSYYSPKIDFSISGSRDYCYLSRYTPLGSSACSLSSNSDPVDFFGYDLSYLSKTLSTDGNIIAERFLPSGSNHGSFFSQNEYHGGQDGAFNCFFEDEVEIGNILEDDNQNERKCNIDEGIKTVNQRLAYAKYKLDYMKKNHISQKFIFKKNNGISRYFNITYELFNWLGFHTGIFNTITDFYSPILKKNDPPKSSGATYSIGALFEKIINANNEHNLNYLAYASNDCYDYLYNFKNEYASSIFGKLYITINRFDKNGGITYNLESTLVFYNDIADHNIDPFGWKPKSGAYDNEEEDAGEDEQVLGEEELDNQPLRPASSQHTIHEHRSRSSSRNPDSPAEIAHRSIILNSSGLENQDENNQPGIDDLVENQEVERISYSDSSESLQNSVNQSIFNDSNVTARALKDYYAAYRARKNNRNNSEQRLSKDPSE